MTKIMSEDYRGRVGVGVDARRLWSGGVASAVVAGLVALTGVLVSRWVFNVPVLAPQQDGAYGDARTTGLILAAMAAALIATGLTGHAAGDPPPLSYDQPRPHDLGRPGPS